MCGRFAFYSPSEAVVHFFDVDDAPELAPRYNIAPTQFVPVIRAGETGRRNVNLLRWGLVPFWAKDKAIGNRMINARAETVAEKPAFRHSFKSRRCLVPANGFYEWKKQGSVKQPYFISMGGDTPFAMAGLWASWKPKPASLATTGQPPTKEAVRDGSTADAVSTGQPSTKKAGNDSGAAQMGKTGQPDANAGATPTGTDEDWLETFTIITTSANATVAPLHDRMPVILRPDDYDRWLSPEVDDRQALQALLQPYDSDALTYWPVSRMVNTPRNDVATLIERDSTI